jgi:hypothetical protein
LDQDEDSLLNQPNPFALVVLTVLLALKNKKGGDDVLLNIKIKMFRLLHSRNMDKQTIRALANFLKMYVHF